MRPIGSPRPYRRRRAVRVLLSAGRLGQGRTGSWRCGTKKPPEEKEEGKPEQYQLFATRPVHLSRLRHQHGWAAGGVGVVLRPAGQRREPDQRGQQRCGSGGASFEALRDEPESLPGGDAGLQPELLADAVQSRGNRDAATLRHTTLATARLRFLFVAAKIWRHAGRTGVSYAIITRRRAYSSG